MVSPAFAGANSLKLHQGAYDSAAQRYFNSLVSNGCTTPTPDFKLAVSNYVKAEKVSGNWGNQDAEYILATADSCTASINLAQPSLYKVTWNVSPPFTVQNGLPGDIATQNGDTGVNLNALTRLSQNNSHIDAWVAANKNAILGTLTAANPFTFTNITNRTTRLTSNTVVIDTGDGNTAGLVASDRTNSTTISTYKNGVVVSNGIANNSSALSTNHVSICSLASTFCSIGTNELFVGFGAAMNNESTHYTNVRNLLVALGVTWI